MTHFELGQEVFIISESIIGELVTIDRTQAETSYGVRISPSKIQWCSEIEIAKAHHEITKKQQKIIDEINEHSDWSVTKIDTSCKGILFIDVSNGEESYFQKISFLLQIGSRGGVKCLHVYHSHPRDHDKVTAELFGYDIGRKVTFKSRKCVQTNPPATLVLSTSV
jgi:hypothetical protein